MGAWVQSLDTGIEVLPTARAAVRVSQRLGVQGYLQAPVGRVERFVPLGSESEGWAAILCALRSPKEK